MIDWSQVAQALFGGGTIGVIIGAVLLYLNKKDETKKTSETAVATVKISSQADVQIKGMEQSDKLIERLMQRVEDLEASQKGSDTAQRDLALANARLEVQLSDVRRELDQLQSQLKTALSSKDELERQNATLVAELKTANELLVKERRDKEAYKRQYDSMAAQYRDCQEKAVGSNQVAT